MDEILQYNIFGELKDMTSRHELSRHELSRHEDYDKFVDKFKRKLTTDDCYTPPKVYDAVLGWLGANCDLSGLHIVRPFYPGGDYEHYSYTGDCAVVDNPPFSIISKIVRFYEGRGIRYFLFAPALTSLGIPATTVICGDYPVVYENGAVVKTAFVTNMLDDDICVAVFPELDNAIAEAQKSDTPPKPTYRTPSGTLCVKDVLTYARRGIPYALRRDQCLKVNGFDGYKAIGKRLFSSGFLLSDKAAADKAAAKVLQLSHREKDLIAELNRRGNGHEIKDYANMGEIRKIHKRCDTCEKAVNCINGRFCTALKRHISSVLERHGKSVTSTDLIDVHAMALLSEGQQLIMFLKVTFLEGIERYRRIFSITPPRYVFVYSARAVCALGGDFEKHRQSAICYAMFVWVKGFRGDPSIKWI